MIGDAHFSEMYAMDWELDSVLISHMGEGNWKIAPRDRPVKLIDRELGIGRLDNPPTPVFSAQPGPATTAALIPVEGDYYRLLVGHGEVLDTPELPKVEMHYFHFRPDAGMEESMNRWLSLAGPHHFVTNLGDHRARWRGSRSSRHRVRRDLIGSARVVADSRRGRPGGEPRAGNARPGGAHLG